MSSDLIDGKRKRSDTEFDSDTDFDSDTESIGNNFPGQNILSNMDFTLANCAKVMEELAKARLKMFPYDTTGGWRDPNTWSTLMLALVGSDCPKTRDGVLEIIFTFESLFKQESRFNITDDELLRNVHIVFGPGKHGDPGSLRTSDLDPLLLPIRKVDSDAVPLAMLDGDGDGDGDGECVVQRGAGNSPPRQKNCKRPKTTFTAEQKWERISNPKNPSVPPRFFKKPMFTILTRSDMVVLYRKSTEHLSAVDAGIFLHHVPPGSVAFQSLALLPFAERKATITAAVKEYKAGGYERRFPPSYYLSHHQQE